jgi:hypothetical protein
MSEKLRVDPDALPVDSKVISAWRDFEQRFADALLMVRSNAVGAQHFMSFDWYERTEWEDADYRAMDAAESVEAIIGFADSQADAMIEAVASERLNWHPVNVAALPKDQKALAIKVREARVAWKESTKKAIELLRGEIQSCSDDLLRSAMKDQLIEIETEVQDDPMPIEEGIKLAMADWRSLKDEAGLDLRGVFRRRALVPFVFFPRHVASHHSQSEMLSVYQNLRQAHEAFVFGAPFAALALMRSIMEVVLRDHYRASGKDLRERISNSRKLLPNGANEAALHRLRKIANAILHLDNERNEALPKLESVQLEKELLSLLSVLRALIEGAPSRGSGAQKLGL